MRDSAQPGSRRSSRCKRRRPFGCAIGSSTRRINRGLMTTAVTDVWYRFGKEDNRVTEVSLATMRRSAYGNFAAPDKTIALGRFETRTLLYVRADKLTAPESERV